MEKADFKEKVAFSFLMHRPVQRKYAAKAAHGSRASKGKVPLADCGEKKGRLL